VVTAVSGAEVIQRLQRESFDVLVTDMMMPQMDGAALLREVMRIAPTTIRIVLSGYAGRKLVQSCEASYHQFLGKPIDPDRFIALLDTFAIGAERPEIIAARRVIGQLQRIPSLPSLHQGLLRLLNQGLPSVAEVSELVRFDLGMAAKVLKLANASGRVLDTRVTNLHEAVTLLTVDLLKEAVLDHAAAEPAASSIPSGLDLAELWDHSAMTAQIAHALAVFDGAGPEEASLCYTGGLLHDLGRVILASDPGLDYRRVLEQAGPGGFLTTALEMELYGTTHAEVGAELLLLWGLDARLCELVRNHHHWAGDSQASDLELMIRFADGWSSRLDRASHFADGPLEADDLQQPRFMEWASILNQHLPTNLPLN
jgi:putative nucleotidyltransferase with HDIG domain